MEWRAIPGYLGLYEVSDEGSVRNANGRILAGWINPYGYRIISLTKAKKRKNYGVHQLVLKAFRRKASPGLNACHNDGVRLNNRLDNLRWATHRSNMMDKRKHGTLLIGSKVPTAIFDEDSVLVVRSRYKAGERIAPMAREYGVNYYTIAGIVYRRTWKHI